MPEPTSLVRLLRANISKHRSSRNRAVVEGFGRGSWRTIRRTGVGMDGGGGAVVELAMRVPVCRSPNGEAEDVVAEEERHAGLGYRHSCK